MRWLKPFRSGDQCFFILVTALCLLFSLSGLGHTVRDNDRLPPPTLVPVTTDLGDAQMMADKLSFSWFDQLMIGSENNGEVPCFYSGAFQQKRELKGLPTSLVTLGRFVHDCHRGLIWEIQTPRQESLIYTQSKRHYKLDANSAQTLLESRSTQRMATLLLNLLGGRTEELAEQFAVTKPKNSMPLTVLTPRNATLKQFLSHIEVLGSNRTLQISVNTVSNGLTTIDIANLQAHERPCTETGGQAGPACELLISSGSETDE